MKVLILITKSNWGGAQRYVYDLAINLAKNHDVEVMAGGGGTLIDKLKQAGINATASLPIGRDVKLSEDIKAFFTLMSIFKKKKPDVIHVNSSKIGGLGALAGRLVGIKKIVFTAHGWAFNEDRSVWSKIIIKFLHWITIILSHKTIAVSEALKKQIENWPLIEDKIVVVHNGIKVEPIFSKVNARNELAKLNKKFDYILKTTNPKDLVVLGSIGELHHIKGYEYSIFAMSEIKSNKKIVYMIMGDGENRVKLEKEIAELGLTEKVLLFGFVTNAFQYLKAFDIFLMPSLSEGLPYVLLEAGGAGVPIISTAVGGIPEIIEDMQSGILIQPRKPKEIAHAIDFYLTHKKTQKEYSLAIQKKIYEDFSIEKMVDGTVKVYS